MSDLDQNSPATVPEQPEAKPPLRKSMPVVVALMVIIGLIGLANISSLLHGNKRAAPASALPMRPSAPNAAQVASFEAQQQLQAKRDEQERDHQEAVFAALQQLQEAQASPGPEASDAPAMTAAQRSAIYGDSPNAPGRTSEVSQAQADAKQRQLSREKQQQDAIKKGITNSLKASLRTFTRCLTRAIRKSAFPFRTSGFVTPIMLLRQDSETPHPMAVRSAPDCPFESHIREAQFCVLRSPKIRWSVPQSPLQQPTLLNRHGRRGQTTIPSNKE
jgi:hypothetical protein